MRSPRNICPVLAFMEYYWNAKPKFQKFFDATAMLAGSPGTVLTPVPILILDDVGENEIASTER